MVEQLNLVQIPRIYIPANLAATHYYYCSGVEGGISGSGTTLHKNRSLKKPLKFGFGKLLYMDHEI